MSLTRSRVPKSPGAESLLAGPSRNFHQTPTFSLPLCPALALEQTNPSLQGRSGSPDPWAPAGFLARHSRAPGSFSPLRADAKQVAATRLTCLRPPNRSPPAEPISASQIALGDPQRHPGFSPLLRSQKVALQPPHAPSRQVEASAMGTGLMAAEYWPRQVTPPLLL